MRYIVQYLSTLVWLLFMAQIGLTYRYWYMLMYHISSGMIPIFGAYVAFQVFFSSWLLKHPNPKVKRFGEIYQAFFAYTAPFQGCLMMTLIFWVLGSTDMGEVQEIFYFDWIYGMTYACWFVFGLGLALPILFFEHKWLSGLFIFAVSWGGLIAFFFYEDAMRAWSLEHPALFTYGITGLQVAMSALSMHALIPPKTGKTGQKEQGRSEKTE